MTVEKLTEENERVWRLYRNEQERTSNLMTRVGELELTIDRKVKEHESERNTHIELIASHLNTIKTLKAKSNLFG